MNTRLILDPNVIASALLGGLTSNRYNWLLKNMLDRFDICYSDTVIEEVTALSKILYSQKKKRRLQRRLSKNSLTVFELTQSK